MPIGSVALAPTGPADACLDRPVAASTALRPLPAVPAPGRVLAAFDRALYVAVGDDVVAVVTADGLRLPNALVLAAGAASAPFARHVRGQTGELTAAGLRVGPVRYRPVRWWAPRTALPPGPDPAVQPSVVAALARHLRAAAPPHPAPVERVLAAAGARLGEALTRGDTGPAVAAARDLVGLGPGLTPSGDDLLAGALVTCVQLRPVPGGDAVAGTAAGLGRVVAADARVRTTALSAALLRAAARGRAAEPVLAVVDALVGRRALDPALAALLAVGHSSGHDTARGVLLAARALLDRALLDRPVELLDPRKELR